MASRKYFLLGTKSKVIDEKLCEFKFSTGFALSQKQKSIISFHDCIKKQDSSLNILEVSTKSIDKIGVELSAFNLKLDYKGVMRPIECVFQASKVFEYGGPFEDIAYMHPIDAKKDLRLKESGRLLGFKYANKNYSLEPKTLFYDWIYCNALFQYPQLWESITKFNCFTDIEFNHNNSINCQARSVAIFATLKLTGYLVDALKSIEMFQNIVYQQTNITQLSMRI